MTDTITPSVDRSTFLGGSDAAAVLHADPFKTALRVWLEKIGRADPVTETDPMFWGKILEDPVAKVAADRIGAKIVAANQRHVHPKHSYLAAEVDRLRLRASARLRPLRRGAPDRFPPAQRRRSFQDTGTRLHLEPHQGSARRGRRGAGRLRRAG